MAYKSSLGFLSKSLCRSKPKDGRSNRVQCRCNIMNFGPKTYRHVPIDYDDYIDVLFLYWVEDPTAYEHDDLLYIYWA